MTLLSQDNREVWTLCNVWYRRLLCNKVVLSERTIISYNSQVTVSICVHDVCEAMYQQMFNELVRFARGKALGEILMVLE